MTETKQPTPIHQSTINTLSEIEMLFVPLLVKEGKIEIIQDVEPKCRK